MKADQTTKELIRKEYGEAVLQQYENAEDFTFLEKVKVDNTFPATKQLTASLGDIPRIHEVSKEGEGLSQPEKVIYTGLSYSDREFLRNRDYRKKEEELHEECRDYAIKNGTNFSALCILTDGFKRHHEEEREIARQKQAAMNGERQYVTGDGYESPEERKARIEAGLDDERTTPAEQAEMDEEKERYEEERRREEDDDIDPFLRDRLVF